MTTFKGEQAIGGLTLDQLVRDLGHFGARLVGPGDVRVFDVQQDSRRAKPGDLFVARAGEHVDGLAFVESAIMSGAAAVLVGQDAQLTEKWSVPAIYVSDPRRASAFAAEAVQGYPSQHLPVIGITGTNGKTTTVALVERGLLALGQRPARLGTVGFSFGDVGDESSLTTPEADDISRLVGGVTRNGGTHFIMEVSSHALDQGRVNALRFEVAAFTNLTQDHLDHHGDMSRYEAAKRRLFVDLKPQRAVINVDNDAGVRFAASTSAGTILRAGRSRDCDVCPHDIVLDAQGIRGEIRVQGRRIPLQTRLIGEHDLENLLLAIGVFHALGVDVSLAAAGLSGDFGVPGRLERCERPGDDIVVLVDYAHTPDALERVLQAVKKFAKGRLCCVFGCGGDRDPTKRPKMGYAVGRWADYAIVTNDNPRTERPEFIADAIEPGLREAGGEYSVELDRTLAIRQAIIGAKPGDVVLIAGKGHEPYQNHRHDEAALRRSRASAPSVGTATRRFAPGRLRCVMVTSIPANTATFSLAELVQATGSILRGGEDCVIHGIVTDSRADVAGKLFVALVGDQFDGHKYLTAAIARGACAVLVEREPAQELPVPTIMVSSTLRALGDISRLHRNRWRGKLVAISGIRGENDHARRLSILVGHCAAGKGSWHPRQPQQPNWRADDAAWAAEAHDYAIVEVGTNSPGEIGRLSELCQPDMAVLTLIGLEHSQGLGDIDDIEREEGDMLGSLRPGGTAIGNGDDRRVLRQMNQRAPSARRVTFGCQREVDYCTTRRLGPDLGRSSIDIQRSARVGGGQLRFQSTLVGLPGAMAAAAALAVVESLGIPVNSGLAQSAFVREQLGEAGRTSSDSTR